MSRMIEIDANQLEHLLNCAPSAHVEPMTPCQLNRDATFMACMQEAAYAMQHEFGELALKAKDLRHLQRLILDAERMLIARFLDSIEAHGFVVAQTGQRSPVPSKEIQIATLPSASFRMPTQTPEEAAKFAELRKIENDIIDKARRLAEAGTCPKCNRNFNWIGSGIYTSNGFVRVCTECGGEIEKHKFIHGVIKDGIAASNDKTNHIARPSTAEERRAAFDAISRPTPDQVKQYLENGTVSAGESSCVMTRRPDEELPSQGSPAFSIIGSELTDTQHNSLAEAAKLINLATNTALPADAVDMLADSFKRAATAIIEPIAVGDAVRHKNGGPQSPLMYVEEIHDGNARCHWTKASGLKERALFPVESLEPADDGN